MVSVDVKHHVYLHLHTPFTPSLINLMVSVDDKHHVYLLAPPPHPTTPPVPNKPYGFCGRLASCLLICLPSHPPPLPSLISLMVSVDVKHHVYLLAPPPPPPAIIILMVSVDVKHYVYLLTLCPITVHGSGQPGMWKLGPD